MSSCPTLDKSILVQHSLRDPRFIETTQFGDIWQVKRADGNQAALKVYGPRGMGGEAGGFAFLDSRVGQNCVQIHFADDKIALMEWLDGPHLGDVARQGELERADRELVGVAKAIHQTCPSVTFDLPPLDLWFESLWKLQFSSEAKSADIVLMQRASVLARTALAEQSKPIPLHGDLHHDNVRQTERGFCAFDAKGVLADLAFECANSFRNPRKLKHLVFDPKRITQLSALWSSELQLDEREILRWTIARTVLSITWRCKQRTFIADEEIGFLGLLLAHYER